MILAGDFKPGVKLLYNNEPYSVIDVTFVKPGKGGAFARTKMKNLITSLVREVTYRTEEKIEQPFMEYKNVQYLYNDGNDFCFLDQDNFEEIHIDRVVIKETINFLKEQEFYSILFWNEKLINITPPIHISLKVIETMPGVRGDTAQGGATKPAKLETGITVNVPLFVEENDLIKVDTRTSEYIERIKK